MKGNVMLVQKDGVGLQFMMFRPGIKITPGKVQNSRESCAKIIIKRDKGTTENAYKECNHQHTLTAREYVFCMSHKRL